MLLPESALKELMLDKLLNRYLMITLCSQNLHGNAVQACRKVCTLILKKNRKCFLVVFVWVTSLYLLFTYFLGRRQSAAFMA